MERKNIITISLLLDLMKLLFEKNIHTEENFTDVHTQIQIGNN